MPIDSTVRTLAPPIAPIDTTDISQLKIRASSADTILQIDGRLYHLRLRAIADSAHMLSAVTSGIVGEAFAADSNFVHNKRVRGPEGLYSITLSESTGRRVFHREFRKANFYSLVGADIAVVAEPEIPVFLGYYPQMGGLAFWQSVSIPQSDVGNYLFLLLDLRGQVRELSYGSALGYGSVDCTPCPAPNGQALLTCSKLLRPGKAPLSLLKPKSELALARFLNDSTLLTIYTYGEDVYEYEADSTLKSMRFVEPPQMKRVPNAFLTTVHGTKLAEFRYNGTLDGLGNQVPRAYVSKCQTYYLLDYERGLRLIDKRNPAATREVIFQQMARFKPPQKPREVRFLMKEEVGDIEFYADQDHPERLRYRKLAVQ
ncbi:hypothetical protein [Hymenobacter volaticus]|uniref:DUF4221 domain-containing protein n=1 Tax=Hymenobacter volaticus TaxID=2932254 RepID=A0ABY4G0Z2_9BACT|nr:hypothetical protein [Hymenobacter volaticus]UOQ64530.1 hypothetical protein MUN86_13140 [Hymenobacter volaticus]